MITCSVNIRWTVLFRYSIWSNIGPRNLIFNRHHLIHRRILHQNDGLDVLPKIENIPFMMGQLEPFLGWIGVICGFQMCFLRFGTITIGSTTKFYVQMLILLILAQKCYFSVYKGHKGGQNMVFRFRVMISNMYSVFSIIRLRNTFGYRFTEYCNVRSTKYFDIQSTEYIGWQNIFGIIRYSPFGNSILISDEKLGWLIIIR